jgi:hypothetical protein
MTRMSPEVWRENNPRPPVDPQPTPAQKRIQQSKSPVHWADPAQAEVPAQPREPAAGPRLPRAPASAKTRLLENQIHDLRKNPVNMKFKFTACGKFLSI